MSADTDACVRSLGLRGILRREGARTLEIIPGKPPEYCRGNVSDRAELARAAG